jgi:hypothetical protein
MPLAEPFASAATRHGTPTPSTMAEVALDANEIGDLASFDDGSDVVEGFRRRG